MIKRVAQALEHELLRQRISPSFGADFSGVTPPIKMELLARAAIEAMRLPTDAMQKAASPRWHRGDWQSPDQIYLADSHALVWERAIDAALAESDTEDA